jgi:uncharacterized protein YecE (DUF72 family)
LPAHDHLRFYTQRFTTVEINVSFYRSPSREQFSDWARQAMTAPGDDRARLLLRGESQPYLTHLEKLRGVDDGMVHLIEAVRGLGDQLGSVLFQLPPQWRANPARLAAFWRSCPRPGEWPGSSATQPGLLLSISASIMGRMASA